MDDVAYLGLDAHNDTIALAIPCPGQQVPDERTIPKTRVAV